MKKTYIPPTSAPMFLLAQHVLCDSGSGWAEMGGYGENSGGGFIQTP